MERLDYLCEHCSENEDVCLCYFYFNPEDIFEIKPRFEYAFEQLTSENSVFKRNMPIS